MKTRQISGGCGHRAGHGGAAGDPSTQVRDRICIVGWCAVYPFTGPSVEQFGAQAGSR